MSQPIDQTPQPHPSMLMTSDAIEVIMKHKCPSNSAAEEVFLTMYFPMIGDTYIAVGFCHWPCRTEWEWVDWKKVSVR